MKTTSTRNYLLAENIPNALREARDFPLPRFARALLSALGGGGWRGGFPHNRGVAGGEGVAILLGREGTVTPRKIPRLAGKERKIKAT